SVANQYESIIQYLMANNASIDGIGFQGHFKSSWGRNQPDTTESIYEQMERFGEWVPHLQITEFDIDVGVYDGQGNLVFYDEVLHAQLMNNYLIAAFSSPDLEGIYMWGFWENSHWLPTAALYNSNWTERFALNAYQDLVFNQWWTNESGQTDSTGTLISRGFKGDYEIELNHDGEKYLQNYSTSSNAPVEFVVPADPGILNPESLIVNQGALVSGGLESTWGSDDKSLILRSSGKSALSQMIEVELETTSTILNPVSILVEYETRANTPGLATVVELFNWDNSNFQLVDQTLTNPSIDESFDVKINEFLPTYVQPSTGKIRARVRWIKTAPTLFSPWQVQLDQLQWGVTD
ncbi:MAG: endo-1,4-beta-xylanase, partial [Planctomycetota bacterium]